MLNKEEGLLKIYQEYVRSWEKTLNTIADTIRNQLDEEGLKYNLRKRVKPLESLNAKIQDLERKGLNPNLEIKDLLGLRIIVPFLEDVERVVELIEESSDVVDIERKSDSLSYREFAYDSVHMEIQLVDMCPELSVNWCQSCEIQIRTILQEAWAEVEHELIYKSAIELPDNQTIRKKLAALNANLVLSDMIFQEIRDKQKELETWGHGRFEKLQKRAKEVSLDSLPKYQSATDTGTGEGTDKGNNEKIEKILLKALKAHNLENYRRAISLYSEALSTDPSLKVRAIIYHHRGLAYFMLNKERQALRDFENSVKCDPGYYQVLNNRAMLLRRMGLTNEALYNFTRSLELEQNQADVFFLRAQTHYETGNYRSAIDDAQMAVQLRPDYSEARALFRQAQIDQTRLDPKERDSS